MKSVHLFSQIIFIGYTGTAIPILIAYLFIKSKRPLFSRMMFIANWILLLGSCAFILATLIHVFRLLNVGDNQAADLNQLVGPYWFGYWGVVFLKGIFPQILWFRKFRKNIVTALVLLLFIRFDYYFTQFVMWYTSLHRDYLPNSYVFYSPTLSEMAFTSLIYLSIVGVLYFLAKRLPEG